MSYEDIVKNIRAEAAKINAGRTDPWAVPDAGPSTAPSFNDYAKQLNYDALDSGGKKLAQESWLNKHGAEWKRVGADPVKDLASYAKVEVPKFQITNTDWLDLAKQAANRSISGISNVIANELPAGSLQQGFQKQGAEYAGYARENAANFSDVTKDRLAREAREQREVEAAGGGELGASALTARHVAERPIATLAQAAGSMVTQLPGLALQGTGGALAATGVGVAPGAGLITAGRALNTVTSAASVAGEVGQGAYDMVMDLPTSKVRNHPEFVRALADAKSLKLSDSEAQLVAHRAVASMAMSEGSKYGLGIGAASGAVSGGLGAGKIAEEAGKKVAGAFLKRAGIEFVSEGTEEAVGQVAQNKAANSGGAAVPLTKGTGSAFVEGAAGGLGLAGAGAAVGKTASTIVDKAFDIATRPNVKPTTKGELMDKVSTGMPQYLQEAALDLIDTIIANPNPTPEMQSEIDASKAQLVSMGMSKADLDGLFAENVAPDPLVNVPSYTDGPAKDVMVGSYKPAETGGRPGTEAPTRLVTELAKEGELTLEAVNNIAGQHEKSYETWVVQTQSQPSRVPTQEFISGTADNMVVTALNLGLPMDAELRTYAEAKALELSAVQDTDPNNLGSRLMADGETLMSESQYQATQTGTAENLIGEYVLYGNAEGYVVQRPNGLYVVDTRPGNTQDIFIESGLSGQSPASIGIKLMAPPKIKVPTGTKGQTPAQLVAEAQLTYDQIKLNDALDLLVLSMPATEAEAFLEALDQRLATNATPGQVAQEIENEINKVLSRDSADSGAVSSQDVPTPDAPTGIGQPAGGSGLNTSAPSDSAPVAEVEVWTAAGAKERITQWLQANGGAGQIRSDVRILDKLPGFVTGELQQGVDAGELEMRGPGGTVVDSVEKMAVFGARSKDASYLFPANTPVDVDPVRVLIHETWHKYQNAETVLRLHELLDRWRQSPVDSIQYKAFLRGEEVIADASDVTGGMNERIPKILDFLWENGVRPDQRTGVARWMDTAIAAVRHVMRHILGKDLGWTAAELMTFAQKMVLDDSNGKEATQYLGEKTKAARREAETKAAKAIAKPRFSTADIAKLSDRGVPLKEFAQQFAGDIKQKDRDVADADKIALDYFDQVIKDPMSVLPTVKGSSLSYKQYLRMPDGLDYDPQNTNHITATDLTKSVYAAVKSGRIEAALEGEAKAANESRAQDLRSLARYLRGNQEYRTTEAAVMLKAAAKWGMRLSTNNDRATVELVEITNKNATAIAVLGGLDAAALSEQMRAGKPLKTAFRDALQQTVDARERAAKASGKDGWVVYKKSDKHEDAVALRDGCAGREWCTAGAVSTAAMQLRQGDFHVFYRDGQPVVALRTVNGRLGEAPRGSLKGQGLTDFERGVAERRLLGQPESIKSKNLPVVQPVVTGGEALKGTPLDPNYGTAPAQPTTTAPTVTGGEDFLDDQKVLNDIQSGAIKQYTDARLWMLQGYRMKAGDYSGDELPLAARETVEAAVKARKSIAQWNKEGYHEKLNSTVDSKEILGAAKYVYGSVYASQNVNMPDLLEVGSVDAHTSDFPNLEIVHASNGTSFTESSATKLHTTYGVVNLIDTSLPALKKAMVLRINEAGEKPLSFDSLEKVDHIYANKSTSQNLSFAKLKTVGSKAALSGVINAPLLESVGDQNPSAVMGTTFLAKVKSDSNFDSLRWIGTGPSIVERGVTLPSLQVVVGSLHLNDLDASQFPALEAVGGVYADKPKALEAAPLLNRVGYKITGKRGESISAPGIVDGVNHSGVIKDTILDPEYDANDPRFALKTSVPLILGGEAFLQEQALLDKIKNNDFDGYSDLDLFSLRYHTVEGDGYESTNLSPVAIEAIDKAVLARHSNAEWMALGYYDDLVAGRNWTGQANPKVLVGDTIEITSQEMADKLSTLEIAPRLKFDATITGDISFNKLRKVDSIYIDHQKNGSHDSPAIKFPVLEEVKEDVVEPANFTGELYAPKLRTIGTGLSDHANAPSNLKSSYPSLVFVNVGFVANSVRLPKLTSGFILSAQVGFDASVSAPLLSEDNINWDFARDEEGNDADFSVADRLRTAAPRAQPRSLEDRLTIIERGELKTKLPVWQDLKDWIVKTVVDGTRPFEAWAREFGTSADQAALNQKKSLARTRVAAYISEIDGAYTRPLAAALSEVVSKTKVKDTIAAKELVGTWMTVRYAQIKNAEFLQQDQAAVDEAEQAFIAAGGNMVGLRAELQAFSTSTPSATRLTLRSERAAKRFAKASDATRAASRAYVTALTKQEDRLQAVNDPNKNLDPVKTPLDAGLAGGYNNATAAEVQRLIEAKIPRALLDKASAPVYEMIQANTQKDLRNGKISLLAYSKWPAQPLYVPLTGDPRTDDTTSDVFGTGSVNQSKDKRAEGRSSSLAQNGIDAAYEQVGKSSQYHGWLPFKQELTKIYERLLSENNNDANTVYEKYGIKRTRETAMTDLSNSVVFRYGANRSTEGGWAYTFDSVAAIEALRHANVEQRPGWLAPIGWATTTAAKLITQFTPGFAVINAFRDGPERFLNLSTRKLANYPGLNMNKVARDAALVWSNPLTIAAARVVLAERLSLPEVVRKVSQSVPDFTPEATKYLREMLGEGASSTTGAYLSRDSGDLAEKLVKINGWPAKTKNMLVVWNDSFELKAPLAMYTALRENGVDKEAAAATVLGTMDFGKAGTAMAPIKALYMFAQPIATGSNELVKTIATTKGKVYAVAMTTAAMGLYAMLSDMAGEDPETKRKRMASISSSTLERSIPVIQPDGTVLKVPVPFGLFQLTWGTGANIMRALNGEQSVAETLGEISKLGFKTFSPISPSETSVARDPLTWAVQTFTPTELKPIANAALNKGAFGGKLDSREFLDPSQPKWKYAKPGTPETYVEASKWLLRNTGMNMSPEVMRELSRVVAVGPLAEVQKGFIDNPHKDALGIKRQSQWFDRYMTTQTPADVVAPPYYHALDQVSDLKKRVEAGERVGDRDRQLLALAKSDETARKSRSQLWSALRKQENGGTIKPEAYRERYQQLKTLELQAQRRFLVNFERLTK